MSNANDTFIINETSVTKTVPLELASTKDENKGDEVKSSTNLEFNRSNIEANKEYVNLVDSDEENKLDMFCYVKCDDSYNDLIKQCRGVVFNFS